MRQLIIDWPRTKVRIAGELLYDDVRAVVERDGDKVTATLYDHDGMPVRTKVDATTRRIIGSDVLRVQSVSGDWSITRLAEDLPHRGGCCG